ncbi:hypothetical protein BGZ80_006205, partial [Entomortierella chlamydospora]
VIFHHGSQKKNEQLDPVLKPAETFPYISHSELEDDEAETGNLRQDPQAHQGHSHPQRSRFPGTILTGLDPGPRVTDVNFEDIN